MAFGDSDANIDTNGEATVLKRLVGEANSPLVIDVGANHGDWTRRALSVNQAAEIMALEPSRHFTPVVDDARRVAWLNLAAGRDFGWSTLYRWNQCDGLSAIRPHHYLNMPSAQEQTLRVTLDWLTGALPRRVTLCKVDVEGAEMDVLEGAEVAIRDGRIETFQIEYGGTWPTFKRRLKDAFDFAARLGLSVYKVVPTPAGVETMAWSEALDSFAYSNWVLSARNNL